MVLSARAEEKKRREEQQKQDKAKADKRRLDKRKAEKRRAEQLKQSAEITHQQNSSTAGGSAIRKRKLGELSHESVELPPSLQCLLGWLDAHGCKRSSLDFRRDGHGGIGAFAKRSFKSGDLLATLPRKCVLTANAAVESPVGVAAKQAALASGAEKYCTPDSLLWVYMCVGRVDTKHPWHPYLASLPADAPDPASWPEEHRALLDNTPVAASIAAARDQVEQCYEHWVAKLPPLYPELFPEGSISLRALLWARGMFTSRGAPSELAHSMIETIGKEPVDTMGAGVMLPLFDLLNHRVGQPITWLSNLQGVHFQTNDQIEMGAEVFNNYGDKPNEELLFFHGFALRENNCDAVSVSMVVSGVRQKYYIERSEQGGIPAELWQALSAATLPEGDEVAEDGAIEVGPEEVELLMATLQKRSDALAMHTSEDQQCLQKSDNSGIEEQRRCFVAIYRQGQREVLSESLETLKAMLGDAEEEDHEQDAAPE